LATTSLASSYILTLPTSAPAANTLIQSDANGNLSFVATSTLGFAAASSFSGINGYDALWTSANTLGTGIILNSSTVAGINATSSSYTFNIQGTAGVAPLNVSSSTGTSLLTVLGNGNVG